VTEPLSRVEARWPSFDPDRIVFEDRSLLVVDKPSGVPTQAARETDRDDLPARLRAFLAARDGGAPYLGIHQRLDRATSGLVLYTRDKAANAPIAKQLEGRTAQKTYLAAVEGYKGGARRLEHRLGPLVDGKVSVVDPRDRRGQDAITHVDVVAREGRRALLSLRLETGRTHQARAQLAAIGSPIAGDRLYGGPAASRLLLHAEKLVVAHPADGRTLTLVAPAPPAFARWLAEGDRAPLTPTSLDAAVFAEVVDRAREERYGLGCSGDTTAFRLLHEDGDGTPGLSVDVYGEHLVAQFYAAFDATTEAALLDGLHRLGFAGIYLKRRPKQANVVVDTRNDALAPAEPVRGSAAPPEFPVLEHGLPFLVRLGDGLSTGIFLDQRENRRRVRELAAGKSVLNLFAYTAPFTVAAAAGGASRTVSVDASKQALAWAERNLAHAGLASDRHVMVVDDVFDWIDRQKKLRERFDLVILDPPSYSLVGARRFSTDADYKDLAARCLALVARGGSLLACSNHRQTVQAKLRRWLHEAARTAQREVVQMKDLPPPVDFPPPYGAQPHLKSVLVTVQ